MTKKKIKTQSYKQFLVALKTDKELQTLVSHELLQHVRDGFSLDSFKFLSVSEIGEAVKEGWVCEKELEKATREGKGYWEGLGRAQSNGTCIGNSKSWYYNMSNRYGWRDRFDVASEHKGNIEVSVVSYGLK